MVGVVSARTPVGPSPFGQAAMTDIRARVERSFQSQGLMATLGARLVSVADGEVRIRGRTNSSH